MKSHLSTWPHQEAVSESSPLLLPWKGISSIPSLLAMESMLAVENSETQTKGPYNPTAPIMLQTPFYPEQ